MLYLSHRGQKVPGKHPNEKLMETQTRYVLQKFSPLDNEWMDTYATEPTLALAEARCLAAAVSEGGAWRVDRVAPADPYLCHVHGRS
jgi:hypothetical protein